MPLSGHALEPIATDHPLTGIARDERDAQSLSRRVALVDQRYFSMELLRERNAMIAEREQANRPKSAKDSGHYRR
jgi:hypothetical protein